MSNIVVDQLQSLSEPSKTVSMSEVVDYKTRIFNLLRKQAAEAGLTLVDGSFETGATVTSTSDVVWSQSDDKIYSWAGVLPKVVIAGTSVIGWTDVSNLSIVTNLNDTLTKLGIGGVSAERISTLSNNNKAGVFSQLQQFSKSRVCRVVHCGTSIANNSNSATKQFLGELKTALGDSGNKTQHLGALGGSYTVAFNGWSKQPYGGFALIRSRGNSSSQTLKFQGVFDEFVLRYSTELDGGSFDVYLDGAKLTTINSNGSQSYGNEYVYGWQGYYDKKYHTIEIMPPASGFAYIETLDMNMNEPGIHILDASLGGSSLKDMVNIRTTMSGQVDGIPISTNNGVDSIFNNMSSRFKPDLIVSTYTVNDAGAGLQLVNTIFKPTLQRLVQTTKTNGVPLLLIVEMGGHYSLPKSSNYLAFQEIRKTILSYKNEPHVTVIDWHDLSGMNTSDPVVLNLLGNRYYSVTDLNVDAATFGGDFIHPNNIGYAILAQQLYSMSGITPYGYQGKSDTFYDEKSKEVSVLPNITSTKSYQNSMSVGLSKQITNEIGRSYAVRVIGKSLQADAGVSEPLYYADDEYNYGTKELNDYIVAGATMDKFGSYRDLSSYNYYPKVPASLSAQSSTFTLTVIVGPGTTTIRLNNTSNTTQLTKKIRGSTGITNTSLMVGTQIVNSSDSPMVAHITVDSYYGSPFFVFTGRMYCGYITPTDFACIPGKNINTARFLKPSVTITTDINKDQAILNQLYLETINGHTIEKICIGGEVIKPQDATGHVKPLYRLQNRSDIKNSRMILEGTLSTNVYDSKVGGITVSTSQNPQRFKSGSSFTSADAGKTHTVCGTTPNDVGVAIYLYTGSTNTYIGLSADGSWVNYGTSHSSAPDLMASFQNYRGMPTSFTFTLPDAATFGAYTWYVYAALRGSLSSTIIGDFTICEGTSATV